MADKKSEGEKAVEGVLPPSEVPPVDPVEARLEADMDKTVPKEGDDAADTPSGHALKSVGLPTKGEFTGDDADKAQDRALRYQAEKHKKRWLG